MITEHIENSIKELKNCRYNDAKIKQYGLIADGLTRYFKRVNQKRFNKQLIISFFELGFFPTRTQQKHVKQIISTLKNKGIISDEVLNKVALQRRVYSLKSNDFESYKIMMNKNGMRKVNYYKFVCVGGIPRRVKVGQTDLNGEDFGEDFDTSEAVQTISRENQGVYSYGNKSIATEKRPYTIKGYIVN